MKCKLINTNLIVEGVSPRQGYQRKEDLRKSIEREGLLEPLSVRKDGNVYVIIDGNMRFSAIKDLGWKSVECIVEDVDAKRSCHLFYVKNTERNNLNPIEISLHIKEMRERFGYSVQDLVDLGYAKDDQTIYNKLRLLKLPKDVQKKIAEGTIKPTEGYKIAAVKDPELQSKVIDNVCMVKNRSVRKTEKIIKNLIDSVNHKDEEKILLSVLEGDIPGVFFHDSNQMREFEDGTIPLIIVSPNYGVGLKYEEGVSFQDHKKDLEGSVPEWGRKLMSGGYLCINFGDIHNFGTKKETEPEIQVMGQIFQDILRPLDVRLRDIKIWDKGMTFVNNRQVSFNEDTKHTSYRSLHNFEYIYIFKKDGKRKVPYDLDLKSRISEREWNEWVSGIWKINPVKSQKGHPAQFPEELPRRLIKMFSYEGDIVVDTALGSGTTVAVARRLGRKGYGYERDLRYKPAIMKKLGITEKNLKSPEPVADKTDTDEIKGDLVHQVQGSIREILEKENKTTRDIVSVQIPLKSVLQKEDVVVNFDNNEEDPDPSGSSPLPQMNHPDDYEGDQERDSNVPAPLSRLPLLLPEKSADISQLQNKIVLGDCLDKLKAIPDNSVDLGVTDPPYGIKFMGKDWDKAVPSVEIWKEFLRVLKPGAFAFVMSIPRQDCQSRMIRNLEDAGFKIGFTPLYWTYAQGFSKAQNISKAVDKRLGAERKKIKRNPNSREKCDKTNTIYQSGTLGKAAYITEPATVEANKLDGSYAGFQPKPAVEVILVAMKPKDEKTYTEQALKNKKGITWFDDCRIPYANDGDKEHVKQCFSGNGKNETGLTWSGKKLLENNFPDKGRFPANLIISDDVLDDGKLHKSPKSHIRNTNSAEKSSFGFGTNKGEMAISYGDTGGFSRFFSLDAWAQKNLPFLIVPKASKKEKNAGLDSCQANIVNDGRKKPIDNPFQRGKTTRKNVHPTVKPVKLMSYLITMGSREGEVVLDCFCGSGSTCVAAKMLNRKFIGIELNEEYHEIAEKRIEAATSEAKEFKDNSNANPDTTQYAGELRKSTIYQDNSSLLNKVSLGDCFKLIRQVENSTVDLALSSPPYANVKDYGEGVAVFHPDNYVDWILPLFVEIFRVLKPTGSFILNINDRIVNKQRHPFVHELIVRATRETGLKLYDQYYWFKKTALPNGNHKRLNSVTEYLLHFCKDENLVKWNMDAVREAYNENTLQRCQYPVGSFNLDVDEKGRPKVRARKIIQLNENGKIPSNVFHFPTASAVRGKRHPAAFHPDLPSWFIRALTDEGDLVLEPFAGSGTTCKVAKELNRKFIGIELNEAYHRIASESLNSVAMAKAA